MKLRTVLATLAILTLVSGVAYAATKFTVTSREFDPAHSFLVQAEWLDGIGCPTSQDIQAFVPPAYTTTTTVTYKDLGCPTGDPSDSHNQGLLLVKTGPTNNNAAAVADIKGVKGPITELGYDLRKPGTLAVASAIVDPRGSHCGAGAPRFDLTTQDGTTYFIGCNSPPAAVTAFSEGWIRLRWGTAGALLAYGPGSVLVNVNTLNVKSISIVFDEGQDTGPDNFGLAVLDNIDINGTLVGQGDNNGNNKGKNKDKGDDNNDQGEND
jgi:hypothetical protein